MHRTKLLTLSLLAVCMALPTAAIAQAKKAPSLLYQISGNGLSKPSYIFGTFHAVCPDQMVPFANLDTYLGGTDQLMMEIDMDNSVEMQSMGKAILIPNGKTIKDLLTAEQFAKVDEMMKNYLGYSAENVKMIKPTMLAVLAMTSPKAIGCKPTAYDVVLMQNAVAEKKPIVGLETVASQIDVIDSKPLDKQAEELYKMAADPQKAIDELKKLMAAYQTRDPEKLFKVANSNLTGDKKFQARLLDDRNKDWIPKLEAAFKEHPTFVAVGAGHLGGKHGVLKLLRKRGYRVEPVKL